MDCLRINSLGYRVRRASCHAPTNATDRARKGLQLIEKIGIFAYLVRIPVISPSEPGHDPTHLRSSGPGEMSFIHWSTARFVD